MSKQKFNVLGAVPQPSLYATFVVEADSMDEAERIVLRKLEAGDFDGPECISTAYGDWNDEPPYIMDGEVVED